jgi:hypothetical protein
MRVLPYLSFSLHNVNGTSEDSDLSIGLLNDHCLHLPFEYQPLNDV